MKGAIVTADRFYTQAIDAARENGLTRDLAANLYMRAGTRIYCGATAAAAADGQESLELARQYFAPVAECVALSVLAGVDLVKADLDKARNGYAETARLAAKIGKDSRHLLQNVVAVSATQFMDTASIPTIVLIVLNDLVGIDGLHLGIEVGIEEEWK